MAALREKPFARRRQAQAGVTLVEVLVVLAVIGVATGAAMLGVGGADRATRAEAEAMRLSRHLALAVDEALVTGASQALVWDRAGYSFTRWTAADGWQPAALPLLAARHDLPGALALRRTDDTAVEGGSLVIGSGGVGPATGFEIAGSGEPWTVGFDGFSAKAAPMADR